MHNISGVERKQLLNYLHFFGLIFCCYAITNTLMCNHYNVHVTVTVTVTVAVERITLLELLKGDEDKCRIHQ